jgi:hypothetical protein
MLLAELAQDKMLDQGFLQELQLPAALVADLIAEVHLDFQTQVAVVEEAVLIKLIEAVLDILVVLAVLVS